MSDEEAQLRRPVEAVQTFSTDQTFRNQSMTV
jgi:hypothetical protein